MAVTGQDNDRDRPDRRRDPVTELAARLAAHRTWLRTHGADGTRLVTTRTDASLAGADLAGADLADADLWAADLRGTDLSGADLSGALLAGADLTGADLTGARLGKADLSGARAVGARLRRAWLVRTDLSGADLTDADLADAYLVRTDLGGADLRGADLRGADLHVVLVDASTWGPASDDDTRTGSLPRVAGSAGTVGPPDGVVRVVEGTDAVDRTVPQLVALLAAAGAAVTVTEGEPGAPPPWRSGGTTAT